MSILGEVYTRPRSEKGRADDRKLWWRRPFTITKSPLLDGRPGLLMRNVVLLGVPPGWKLTLNIHYNVDIVHPHAHGGRFVGLILWGGYWEERVTGGQVQIVEHRPGHVNFIDNDTYHAVRRLRRRFNVTLGLIFPNVQDPGHIVEGEFKSFGRYFMEGHHTREMTVA